MARILIIEDEEILITMLAEAFRRLGHEVIISSDGEDGLSKIKANKPDLVLLDIIMPKLSGMEVLEKVHDDKSLKDIPIIIISNSGQPVEIEKAQSLGVRDYLVKTEFDPKEVVEKANRALKEVLSLKTEIDIEKSENSARAGNDAAKSVKESHPKKPARNFASGGKTVLVVEDDQFLRDLIVRKLDEEGLTTLQAIDGEEGLRLVREKKPAIVLLDLILPGIDGFEVLARLKTDSSVVNIPVVILSNLGQKDDIDRGLKLGATDYLIKAHFTPGEIVQKVKDILQR